MGGENIRGLAEATVGKLKDIVESSTVIGEAITTPDGSVIIPVSKVNVGFGSGGVDFKNPPEPKGGPALGGGCGGGVTITPVAFLVVSSNGSVKMLQVADKNQSLDRAMNTFPDIINQISQFIEGFKNKDSQPEIVDDAETVAKETISTVREVTDIEIENK